MWLFWVAALIPISIGILFLWKDKQMAWQEWVISSVAALAMAGLFQLLAGLGMTADIETWSGEIVKAEHHPRWVEEWEEMHTRQVPSGTDKDGNTTYTTEIYYTTEHDTHPEHWECTRNYGSYEDSVDIDYSLYIQIKQKFGNTITYTGTQSTHHGGSFDGGDRSIYGTENRTGYVYPVTSLHHFENRVKAAPTVFSYVKVPTNIAVYPWPKNNDWMTSDRLLGVARNQISIREWDVLNSKLGPQKKVNLIMVGFGNQPHQMAEWQEAAWIGGKKNDLVICYGEQVAEDGAGSIKWAKVFGWTEKNLVKRNIETIVLENKIDNSILSLIANEVLANYEIKDWSKFDYITIEPPTWSYVVYFIVMILIQGGLYFWFHNNDLDQEPDSRYGTWLDRLTNKTDSASRRFRQYWNR